MSEHPQRHTVAADRLRRSPITPPLPQLLRLLDGWGGLWTICFDGSPRRRAPLPGLAPGIETQFTQAGKNAPQTATGAGSSPALTPVGGVYLARPAPRSAREVRAAEAEGAAAEEVPR